MRPHSLETSFQQLFHSEYEKLCRFALAYMQDGQLAEDVVQETFIRIWEQKKDLITAPNVRFYLITAVKNNCISALRKQKTQAVIYGAEPPEAEAEPFFIADENKDGQEDQRKITAALNMLPPKCREVFLLVKLQSLSYKQTAETLGISIKTVENQMGKALKIFREISMSSLTTSILLLMEICVCQMGVF